MGWDLAWGTNHDTSARYMNETLPDAVVILRDQAEGHLLHLVKLYNCSCRLPQVRGKLTIEV